MDKKYILTEEAKDIVLSDGLSKKRLYRIMAFRDFGSVKADSWWFRRERKLTFLMRVSALFLMML